MNFIKDPSEVLDYTVSFKTLLQTDTISTITVVGTNVTIDSSSDASNVVTIWVSGGSAGNTGTVKTTVVTAAGRTHERTFSIEIEDR